MLDTVYSCTIQLNAVCAWTSIAVELLAGQVVH